MNEFEPEQLENDLSDLKPAAVPENLMSRLATLNQPCQRLRAPKQRSKGTFIHFLPWLTPLAAAAAVAIFLHVQRLNEFSAHIAPRVLKAEAKPIKADNVEVVQQLVGTFDAVTRLPDGQPVRFRCSEWFDDVLLLDSSQGILIQHRVPRLEVKQVNFETY